MEAVPRLPMISFQLKVSPEPTIFGAKIKQYIHDFYHEDPESYNNEVHQLENLRAAAVRSPIDMAGCLLLKKYYCQLHFLQSRFPMGKDGVAAVTYTWKDTYANMVCSLANIRFEIISILYNIGSMHTQLGSRTERTSADGMKMACAHFQCAAWAFEHLKSSFPQPSGVDLAPELMTFMHQLCLAQAQECILEKSMLDNRKPTIVAKVAKQIVDYFALALTTLEQGGSEDGTIADTVGTKIYKNWKRYVKFKKAYHLAVTHLYQGLAAEEQRKMGERVAFYNTASTSLNEAHSIYTNSKGSTGITGVAEEKNTIEEALTFTNDVIEGKRKAAKNENEFIYHEEVPEKETLPMIKGASLVKGISFNINDPEVSGPDIFARLVPMKVHEASSLYSEEKAKILRSISSKIDEKDQLLNTYLASLKLEHMSLWDPDVKTTEWERLPLPDDLIERCAALNAKQHVIQELIDIMEKLSDTSHDVEKILKEMQTLLLDEELKEKQYQNTVGKRPPSIVATDLTREAKKYEEAHNKASESNHALHKAISMHVKNLKILAQPLAELVAHVPSPSNYLKEQNKEKSRSAIELERMHTKELKRILNKVDEMRRQRNELHSKLRDSIAQDDLTRLLVTASSDSGTLDCLFADQLRKHHALVNLIEQNLVAQDNILAALTDVYAQTANVRKGVEETLKRRDFTVSSLIASYDSYEDLLAKSRKGLEFYRKLEINVSKLLQRLKSTCKVQEEEREHILAQDNKNSQDNKLDHHNIVPNIATPATSYEQARSRSSSGLKLKDYLNTRAEHVSTHQNQYYNVYKAGQDRPTQVDVGTKSYTSNEGVDSIIVQPSCGITATDATGSIEKTQNYYPTSYTDYKTNLPYSYETRAYNKDPSGTSSLNQNYLQVNISDATVAAFQQIPTVTVGSTSPADMMPMQYSTNSFASNGQFPTQLEGQDKNSANAQSQYNIPSKTLQYEAFNPSVYYPGYNTTPMYSQNLNNIGTSAKADQERTPSSETALPNTGYNTVDEQAHLYGSLKQGQYISEASQQICQNNSQTLNYSLVNQKQISDSQNSTKNLYYARSELKPQQSTSAQSFSCDTSISSQYIPTQYVNVPRSVHATNSLTASTGNMSSSFQTNVHSTNTVQYSQQDCSVHNNQSNQIYADKSYLQYSLQQAVQYNPNNDTASLSYPATYQSHMIPTETYSVSKCCPTTPEIIQSHAKSTTVQSYWQPGQSAQLYQYPQQSHNSGYMQPPCADYSHGYAQDYNYIQGSHTRFAYDPTHQCYQYNTSNVQTATQPLQALQQASTISMTMAQSSNDSAANNFYQQQESSARYTNASNNTIVSQTPSSRYPGQAYTLQDSTNIYYTTQYGLQMQTQGSTSKSESNNYYNQTYMQANNNGTNTTTSSNPVKTATKASDKSNVDLLSDLDVTINHAPLVPEVRPLSKHPQEELSSVDNVGLGDRNKIKKKKEKDEKEQDITNESKNETENLQIVWDTWYNDVQPSTMANNKIISASSNIAQANSTVMQENSNKGMMDDPLSQLDPL